MANIEYRMGPKRPARPNPPVINAISRGLDKAIGQGGTFIVTSGKGNYGSVRHRQGDAVDGKFLDQRGNEITLSDKRMLTIVLSCASEGITGFGAGPEYMGNSVVHMDVYPLSKYSANMGRAWGSYGDRVESRFIQASVPGGGGVGVPTNLHDEYGGDLVEEDGINEESKKERNRKFNPLGDARLNISNPFLNNPFNNALRR